MREERDLGRQVVRSDSAQVRFPSVDLEIPPNTQKGGMYGDRFPL